MAEMRLTANTTQRQRYLSDVQSRDGGGNILLSDAADLLHDEIPVLRGRIGQIASERSNFPLQSIERSPCLFHSIRLGLAGIRWRNLAQLEARRLRSGSSCRSTRTRA